jgi:hypothetical protein
VLATRLLRRLIGLAGRGGDGGSGGAGQTGQGAGGAGAGDGADFGMLAQPASPRTRANAAHAASAPRGRGAGKEESCMAWLALEIVLGLAIFVWLIWWTLPRKRSDAKERVDDGRGGT